MAVGSWTLEGAGLEFRFRSPSTVREVLKLRMELDLPRWGEWVAEREYSGELRMPRLRWLRDHTVYVGPIDGAEWSEMDGDEQLDLLDEVLGKLDAHEYEQAIVSGGGLPPGVADQLGQWWEATFRGGCECRVCVGKRPDADPKEEGCLLAGVEPVTWRVLEHQIALEGEALLDAPWWMFEAHMARMTAKGRVQMEKKEEESKVNETQELYEQYGWSKGPSRKSSNRKGGSNTRWRISSEGRINRQAGSHSQE